MASKCGSLLNMVMAVEEKKGNGSLLMKSLTGYLIQVQFPLSAHRNGVPESLWLYQKGENLKDVCNVKKLLLIMKGSIK